MEQLAPQRKKFSAQRTRIEKRRFIPFRAMHHDINNSMIILLRLSYICTGSVFLAYYNRAMYLSPKTYHSGWTSEKLIIQERQDFYFTAWATYGTPAKASKFKFGDSDAAATNPKFFILSHNSNMWCTYHMDSLGHHTDGCWPSKHKVQDLFDSSALAIDSTIAHNSSQNLLPSHNPVGPST